MSTKRIVINIQDNVTDALVKSQNKRLQVLESLIKKKSKKKDVSSELAELNLLKKMVSSQNSNFEKKSGAMLEAFKSASTRPFMAQVIPSPS